MTYGDSSEVKELIELVQEKRIQSSDRIPVVLDFDFYLRPLNHTSRVSREEKHSSHTIDISPGGMGFLYPAKATFEEDFARSGSISKNTIVETYLSCQNKRFRFNAQRAWHSFNILKARAIFDMA